jgi:hypothetical protein
MKERNIHQDSRSDFLAGFYGFVEGFSSSPSTQQPTMAYIWHHYWNWVRDRAISSDKICPSLSVLKLMVTVQPYRMISLSIDNDRKSVTARSIPHAAVIWWVPELGLYTAAEYIPHIRASVTQRDLIANMCIINTHLDLRVFWMY